MCIRTTLIKSHLRSKGSFDFLLCDIFSLDSFSSKQTRKNNERTNESRWRRWNQVTRFCKTVLFLFELNQEKKKEKNVCWQSTLAFFFVFFFFLFLSTIFLNWKSKRQTREWKIIIVLFQNSLLSCHKHSLVYEAICKKKKKKKKILTKLVQIKERIIDEKNSGQIVESVEKEKNLFAFFSSSSSSSSSYFLSFSQRKEQNRNLSFFKQICHALVFCVIRVKSYVNLWAIMIHFREHTKKKNVRRRIRI